MSKITRVISHYKREREKRKIQKIYQEVFQQDDYFDSTIYTCDEIESCRAISF